jgi:hypothetical protein
MENILKNNFYKKIESHYKLNAYPLSILSITAFLYRLRHFISLTICLIYLILILFYQIPCAIIAVATFSKPAILAPTT